MAIRPGGMGFKASLKRTLGTYFVIMQCRAANVGNKKPTWKLVKYNTPMEVLINRIRELVSNLI